MQKQVARPGESVAAMAGLTLPVQVTVGDFGSQYSLGGVKDLSRTFTKVGLSRDGNRRG